MNMPADSELFRPRPSLWNLMRITVEALQMWPPDYVRSFLGPYRTWLPPHHRYSEFTIVDLWRLRRTLKFLRDITVPSISGSPPPAMETLLPPALEELFFVSTELLHHPDYYGDETSFCDERWFFINGILTNGDFAQLNADCLTYLFHRPITLIQNCTDGAVRDLYECALGKEWYENTSHTESARVAFPAIYDALKDPCKRRVVVICHSQGTIIMAVVLRGLKALAEGKPAPLVETELVADLRLGLRPLLTGLPWSGHSLKQEDHINPGDFEPLTEQEWEKLEIYCFATCANSMRYHRGAPGRPVPWIEHFGNEHDLIARLGMLAPRAREEDIELDGPFYVRARAWGHLLNIDYLLPIIEHQKCGRAQAGTGGSAPFALMDAAAHPDEATPRLYAYINGGAPVAR